MSSATGAASRPEIGVEQLLATLKNALRALGDHVLDGATADQVLTASVVGLHQIETMAQAEKLRRVAEVDRRAACVGQAARTTAQWMSQTLGLSRQESSSQVATAAGLQELPATADAFRRGELGAGQAQTAVRAAGNLIVDTGDLEEADPAAEEAAREGALTALDQTAASAGCQTDPQGLRRRLQAWQADRDRHWRADQERAAHARRGGSIRLHEDGGWQLTARLDVIGGAKVDTALAALARAGGGPHDQRSYPQRVADALVELADTALAGDAVPQMGERRPQVLLVTTAETLHGRDDSDAASAQLDGYGPVSAATARQVCCDAALIPVSTERNGTVLDIGDASGNPTRKQRHAVIARDRVCVGCGAPASRCEIHHVAYKSSGGGNQLANLTLLCWNCHHHVHHFGWQVTTDANGRYQARPPVASMRASPRAATGPSAEAAPLRPDSSLSGALEEARIDAGVDVGIDTGVGAAIDTVVDAAIDTGMGAGTAAAIDRRHTV